MRKTLFSFSLLLAAAIVLAGFTGPSVPASDKPKAEELVSKHLDALGTPEARTALKSLNVEGNALAKFTRGGTGQTGGPFAMVSSGHKLVMKMTFAVSTYLENLNSQQGESFAFDGEKKSIGYVNAGQRSQLEDFMNHNGEVLAEGLIGGALSTAWPLYDLQKRDARLDVDGLKKVDGKELFRVTYHPRHGTGDLKIYLFFDPENFRHVKTIYMEQSQAQLGSSIDRGSFGGLGGGGANLTLEEDFGGFAKVNKLMLPTQWTLKYEQEGVGSGNSLIQFDMNIAKIEANPNVSGVTFRVQ
jgi:hypothetical protein